MANAHGLSDEAVKTIIRKTAEWTADELPAEEVDQDEFIEQQARRLAATLERDFARDFFRWIVNDFTQLRRVENGIDLRFLYDVPNNDEMREFMASRIEDGINIYVNEVFNSLTVGV